MAQRPTGGVRYAQRNDLFEFDGAGFLSSSDPRLHFGLGAVEHMGELEVTWPDGEVDVPRNVSAGSSVVIRRVPGGQAVLHADGEDQAGPGSVRAVIDSPISVACGFG